MARPAPVTDAPPVLLLHGQPGSAADWRPVVDALSAAGVTVLAPDRPGWGRHEAPAGGLEHNARAAVDALDAHGATAAIVVGHSFGGAVAAWLAARHPERVGALVLIGPAANGSSLVPLDHLLAFPVAGYLTSASLMAGAGMALALGPARRLLARPLGLDERFLDAYGQSLRSPARWSAFTREQRALIEELPALESQLAAITAPTTIVSGERDRVVPPGAARRLVDQIPDAELVVLPGAGHLIPQQQTRELIELIEARLRRYVDPKHLRPFRGRDGNEFQANAAPRACRAPSPAARRRTRRTH